MKQIEVAKIKTPGSKEARGASRIACRSWFGVPRRAAIGGVPPRPREARPG